jgi:hypothetical protein
MVFNLIIDHIQCLITAVSCIETRILIEFLLEGDRWANLCFSFKNVIKRCLGSTIDLSTSVPVYLEQSTLNEMRTNFTQLLHP